MILLCQYELPFNVATWEIKSDILRYISCFTEAIKIYGVEMTWRRVNDEEKINFLVK